MTRLNVDFDTKRKFSVSEGGSVKFRLRDIAVEPGKKVSLKKDFDPDFTGGFKDKSDALARLANNVLASQNCRKFSMHRTFTPS